MSFAIPADRETCDDFFGELFKALPNVLFVMAAGNNGEREPFLCPASLAEDFTNAVSVAGVLPNGELANESNYGSHLATVAAPFVANCTKPVGQEGSDRPSVKSKCYGTSVAAATVSNLAMKWLQRDQTLTSSDLKRKFIASYQGPAAEVYCNGNISDAIQKEKSYEIEE